MESCEVKSCSHRANAAINSPWKHFMAISLLTLATALSVQAPNFVAFFGDDWGWGDLGAANPDVAGLTPHMDRLALLGVRFTDFHSGASVCTPARAALLTGRLGLRTGVVRNFNPRSDGGLPLNETTIAELVRQLVPHMPLSLLLCLCHPHCVPTDDWLTTITTCSQLKSHGYRTGMIGKCTPTPPPLP
jgi:arylsulfatase A-like enzyme